MANEGNRPSFNFDMKKRFIFAIEISDPYILQEVFKIAQECRGTIVKVIDKNRPPDALISDAKHAPYLQHHSYEENIKHLLCLPLIAKDAIQQRVPVIFTESFLEAWEHHLRSRGPSRKNVKRLLSNSQQAPSSSSPATVKKKENALSRVVSTDVVVRDADPQYGVMYKHMKEPPIMHIGANYGISLFHRAAPDLEAKRKLELEREENGDYQYQNVVPTPFKEYGKAKPSKAVNVYCEICKTSTSNLASHVQSSEHKKLTTAPGFYDEVDEIMKGWNNPVFTPRESGEQKEDFADRKAQMHTEFEEMRFPNDKDIFDDTPPIGANDEDAVMVPLTATNNNNNEDLMMPKCENHYPG